MLKLSTAAVPDVREAAEEQVHGGDGGLYDDWSVKSTSLVRHHIVHRAKKMYIVPVCYCPLPRHVIGVVDVTPTVVGMFRAMLISSTWIPEAPMPVGTRALAGERKGTTMFRSIRPEHPAGHHWYLGKRFNTK